MAILRAYNSDAIREGVSIGTDKITVNSSTQGSFTGSTGCFAEAGMRYSPVKGVQIL